MVCFCRILIYLGDFIYMERGLYRIYFGLIEKSFKFLVVMKLVFYGMGLFIELKYFF